MNKAPRPENWTDIIGPVYREDILPEDIRNVPGIICLVTTDEVHVYPTFQFRNKQVIPHVATAWQLLSELDIEQLAVSPWTAAAALVSPREALEGKSYFDVLSDPDVSDETAEYVHELIIISAVEGGGWQDIAVTPPTT